MGLIALLKFSLFCIDLLAWPVIALGYPLFASIRAVETGSKFHMRKLVTYWILFSLIYLFEFVFAKIIEWIPIWSNIKLIITLWLVMPRFDGACHAYQSLIRPCLSMDLQAVADKFYRPREEKPRNTQTVLDVADKYIKENGSEALEKLIASKWEHKEPDNPQRDTRVLEPEEKNAASTSKQLKEPDAAQKDNAMLENAPSTSKQLKEPDVAQKDNAMIEATEKNATTEAKPVQPRQSITAAWAQKDADTPAEIKEMTPPEASAENRHMETSPPLNKVQREWTCALCQVTTTSEKILNAHLQGKKHKSKCEHLKTSKLHAKDTGPSTSATGKSNQGNPEAVKSKVGKGSQQKTQATPKKGCAATQPFKLWCNVCNVQLLTDIDLASHLWCREHARYHTN